MKFQHYLFLILRHSWLIVLIVAITLGGTWAWLSKQTTIYTSRAVLQVEKDEARVVKIEEVTDSSITNAEQMNTVVQTLSSNTLLLAVAKAIGRDVEWAKQHGSDGKLAPGMENALANSIASQLKISLRRSTRLIDIVSEDKSPEKARNLASEVVHQFFAMQNQDRTDISKDANRFLVAEAEKLKTKLQDSENKLAQYRQEHKAVSLDKDRDIVSERLTAINSQVTQAAVQRAALESDLAALGQIKQDDVEGLLKLRSVAAIPEVAQLRTTLVQKEGDFATVKQRYGPRHPKYGEAQSQLEEIRNKVRSAVADAGDTLRQQYQSFKETEQSLKQQLKNAEDQTLQLAQVSIPYNVLKREADTDRTLYEAILTRLKETGVTQGLVKTPYKVIEDPLVNPNPIWPIWKRILSAAGALALAASVGLIILLDRMDSSLRTVDEAESSLGLGVLAAVPDGDLSRIPKGGTVMTDDSNSSQAEAFRTLRASLSLLGEEDKRRIILVTSAIPAEGKTFTSANLAASFATQGLSVILIDADLRRPALSAFMLERDIRQNEDFRGLTDVLSGLCSTEEATRATRVPNLSLLSSGRRAPNPAELLSQGGMEKLLKELSHKYDRIVLDTAPINAVSDSLGIAPLAHAVCLVLRYGKTPRRAITRALGLLKKSGARMAGVIMNRMPSKRGAAYYYYYYGDPYIKGDVYGGSDPGKSKGRKKSDKAPPAPAAEIPVSGLSRNKS
ncbi:MAG: polysaccharide biosynthesis tyrosine autokinase [Verrucomicrobiota bacterium]